MTRNRWILLFIAFLIVAGPFVTLLVVLSGFRLLMLFGLFLAVRWLWQRLRR